MVNLDDYVDISEMGPSTQVKLQHSFYTIISYSGTKGKSIMFGAVPYDDGIPIKYIDLNHDFIVIRVDNRNEVYEFESFEPMDQGMAIKIKYKLFASVINDIKAVK